MHDQTDNLGHVKTIGRHSLAKNDITPQPHHKGGICKAFLPVRPAIRDTKYSLQLPPIQSCLTPYIFRYKSPFSHNLEKGAKKAFYT